MVSSLRIVSITILDAFTKELVQIRGLLHCFLTWVFILCARTLHIWRPFFLPVPSVVSRVLLNVYHVAQNTNVLYVTIP
jgi:hypothetical protein